MGVVGTALAKITDGQTTKKKPLPIPVRTGVRFAKYFTQKIEDVVTPKFPKH